MKRSGRAGRHETTSCRTLTLPEVRASPRIPSGYVTDRVWRVAREVDSTGFEWCVREERLERPVEKVYDDGDVDDWLDTYQEAAEPGSMRFLGVFGGSELLGLATWTYSRWNNTVWLTDIRVKRDRRRAGAGSELLGRVKDEAGKLHARGVRVETQFSNYPAISFYRKHGFAPSGLDDHLYSNRDLEKQDIALFLFWEQDPSKSPA